ncbi:Spo0E family sporulation regulatory protein-aspartic acid phosphatase [Peribacillus tepidiphilus]|uniref:Spo0E family sporulation regulatory protein-aspartic acid phosphatase n=1 Tax=Peribacillus tepidiphilus TaxID=2652445 RepID=UPI0035B56D28
MDRLQKSIEEKRQLMIDSANKWGTNSKITIKYSQELDILLNAAQNKSACENFKTTFSRYEEKE